jgi:Zn-dependent protease with chaperone function
MPGWYRDSVDALAAVVAVAVAAVASLILFAVTSQKVKAIEALENPDRIHALRTLTRRVSPIAFCCGIGSAAVGIAISVAKPASASFATSIVVTLVCLAAVTAAINRPIRRGIATARGVTAKSVRSNRRLAMNLASTATLVLPFLVAWAVPLSLPARVLLIVIGNVVISPLIIGLLAPLFARLVAPSAASADLTARLAGLSDRAGIRMRGRILPMLERREARAQQLGWLPGLRYVLVSDYLLERFPEQEADAVLCHELAHAVHRDGLVRLMITSVQGAAVGVSLLFGVIRAPENDLWYAVAIMLAAVIGGGRLRSVVTIRQELAADQFAAKLDGPERLISALNMLIDMNSIKSDTSPSWDRWVRHPAIAKRIALLQGTTSPS